MKIVIGLVVVILLSMPCLHCHKLNAQSIKVSFKVVINVIKSTNISNQWVAEMPTLICIAEGFATIESYG